MQRFKYQIDVHHFMKWVLIKKSKIEKPESNPSEMYQPQHANVSPAK